MFEQELNTYWKTVLDTIHDSIIIVDKGGIIVSVNKAFEKMTEYSREDIIGKPCSILKIDTCEILPEKAGCQWCKLFGTGKATRRKCSLIKKDGKQVHVLKNASLINDVEGRIIGAVETMTDLTEIIEKNTQIEAFRRELRAGDGFHGIVGASAPMQRVFDLITNAADSDAPVIIFGESGTGKELVAKAVYEVVASERKPYVKVNCAALNESLLESELFGHVKGAFTGAYRNREGRFEAADGGYIFLDEIGDLPLSTQVKLLRVLEEKVIERVGDNRPIHIDVRIISATNKNLSELVNKGLFREDLFYRINVIPIFVPPLRKRAEDIPLLAKSLLRRIQLKSGKEINGITNDAMSLLMNYAWPGNVRELMSAFEYAFVSCHETVIQPHHFPPAIFHSKETGRTADNVLINRYDQRKMEMIRALEEADGNQSKAARILGVSRVTVWNRMRKFGINFKRKIDDS